MAGDNHMIKVDPAIERWALMRENLYQGFRFTPLKTRQVLTWMVGFPGLVYWLASSYDDKYRWIGRKKGESLQKNVPSS